MHLAFALLGQLTAAYAAKRSITAKRRMFAEPKLPLQVNLRGLLSLRTHGRGENNSAMHLAFALLGQLTAAYAAKRSITAKRRMFAEPKLPLQVNLRGLLSLRTHGRGENNSAMHLAFALLRQLTAAYAAKRSITAKRRMFAEPKLPLQVNLRGLLSLRTHG